MMQRSGIPHLDEAEAIRRCQEGDGEAFRVIVERHHGALCATAFLMTRDRALAEDAAQEAFLLAWRHFCSFAEGGNLRAWLMRIMVNRTRDLYRKRRVPEAPEDLLPLVPDDYENGAEQQALRREEQELMASALALLPDDQREALVLRYYADLSIPEIVKALGWPEGTVKSRLHRGLARLRELLGSERVRSEE